MANEMKILKKEEIIDKLIIDLNNARRECLSLKYQIEEMKESQKVLMEGLKAIEEFGDSQGIAEKTIEQMHNLFKK